MNKYLHQRTEIIANLYEKAADEGAFIVKALEIFRFQYLYNPLYRQFVDLLGIQANEVNSIDLIPFLPAQLFKTNKIKTGNWTEELVFESSSTSGQNPSKHYLKEARHYSGNSKFCFEEILGKIHEFKWFALLPHYLERGNSSLVYMAKNFMEIAPQCFGGFFMDDFDALEKSLTVDRGTQNRILLGVSYALLDFSKRNLDLSGVIVMETGGMKGRGKELPRHELYQILKERMNLNQIYSEYGMTELLSQAYTEKEEVFTTPSTMKILISDLNDPQQILHDGSQGRVNVIDLANFDTCSFISTDDLGMNIDSKHFKILGRTDASELRGCNLLYTH